MAISPKDVIPLTKARATLTDLFVHVRRTRVVMIITTNGESCAARIDADLLDHYHRLEREHIHLTLLEEAVRGMADAAAGKTVSLKKIKARYGR
jgi:PHD/YefM family antitoxin component YafN of YafNO toxin-antitoxin module